MAHSRWPSVRSKVPLASGFVVLAAALLGAAAMVTASAWGQAIIISSKPTSGPIDRRYTQIEPTKLDLPAQQLDARGHQDLLRVLLDEQGFAMRPLPRGKKGLLLAANGSLSPAGEGYLMSVTENGLSVKPGDRVVLSNVKIDREKIVFDINGGPEHRHEFMRHLQVGVGGPNMSRPVVQDDGTEPTGARVTLTFSKFVPLVTPAQVKALLAPLISFDMKSPAQAYTDTLPPTLKAAILDHQVLVGMSTDMVLYALGQPEKKSREMDGQMPFEEWIYGHPPQDVKFVRVNGNRVIRVEISKLGQPLAIYTRDEVEGLMTTDGKPVLAEVKQHETRTVALGDTHPDLETHAPNAQPTLRAPGEKLPDIDHSSNEGGVQMKPVIFPKDTSNDPARNVDAHPEKTRAAAAAAGKQEPTVVGPVTPRPVTSGPVAPNSTSPAAKPAATDAPAQQIPAPQAPAPSSPPPSSFYRGRTQPAVF